MIDNTNAERQRRYIAKLKAGVSNVREVAALRAEIAALKAEIAVLRAVSNAQQAPRPKKTISPETRAKMAAGQKRTRDLNAKIAEAYKTEHEFEKTIGRRLGKIEALAADQRGDANVRLVAEDMAEKLRQTRPPPNPYRPPPLPVGAEWEEHKRKIDEERRAKRAAAKAVRKAAK